MRSADCGHGYADGSLYHIMELSYLSPRTFSRSTEKQRLPMEPIGAAASIITFIQATAVLAKSIQIIYKRWQHAPGELQGLAALLTSLEAELEIVVHCTATAGHSLVVDTKCQIALAELLQDARVCIEQFEAVLTRVQEYGNVRQRTMWATHESRRMDKVIIRLQAVEKRLSHWLQAMSLYAIGPPVTL
jgi:hypothetical protein